MRINTPDLNESMLDRNTAIIIAGIVLLTIILTTLLPSQSAGNNLSDQNERGLEEWMSQGYTKHQAFISLEQQLGAMCRVNGKEDESCAQHDNLTDYMRQNHIAATTWESQ